MNTLTLKDYSPISDEEKEICKELQDALDENKYKIHIYNEDESTEKEKIKVFDYYANCYFTQQYIGVLVHNNQKIVLGSRFDNDKNQYFLNYVFCKAYGLNPNVLHQMNPSCEMEKTWDFLLIFMFLDSLEKAFRKGYYKEYKKNHYNNPKLKGAINIARHMKENMLFSGDIAYSRRENTIDNPVNKLILITLNYINKKYNNFAHNILKDKDNLKDCLEYLNHNLHSIDNDAHAILKDSLKPVTRHIFKDYEKTRVLARLILKNMGLNIFSESTKEVRGVLFNMTNLWEKFLENTFFAHAKDNEYTLEIQDELPILYKDSNPLRTLKPDYVLCKNDKPIIILDAKYKEYIKDKKVDAKRNDVFQMLSYMYAYGSDKGGLIFPIEGDKNEYFGTYTLLAKPSEEDNRKFYSIPIKVPCNSDNFASFGIAFDENIKKSFDSFNSFIKEV